MERAQDISIETTTELENSLDQDDNGAGSGGSVGWSDLSEVDVNDSKIEEDKITEDELSTQLNLRKLSLDSNAPDVTLQVRPLNEPKITDDLFEIAELKSKIRKLISERDSLKYFFLIL